MSKELLSKNNMSSKHFQSKFHSFSYKQQIRGLVYWNFLQEFCVKNWTYCWFDNTYIFLQQNQTQNTWKFSYEYVISTKKMPAKILIIFSLSKHKISCIGSVNAWWWSDSKNKYWKKSWISLYLEKSREVKKNFFPTVDLWRKPCKYSFVYNVFFLFYCIVTNLINFEIFHIQEAKTI